MALEGVRLFLAPPTTGIPNFRSSTESLGKGVFVMQPVCGRFATVDATAKSIEFAVAFLSRSQGTLDIVRWVIPGHVGTV
jgi:hypothetical protein